MHDNEKTSLKIKIHQNKRRDTSISCNKPISKSSSIVGEYLHDHSFQILAYDIYVFIVLIKLYFFLI